MAINTKEIGPLAPFEVADPFTVDAGLPITVNIAVTLAAKAVRLSEINGLTICKLQLIAVSGAMAI